MRRKRTTVAKDYLDRFTGYNRLVVDAVLAAFPEWRPYLALMASSSAGEYAAFRIPDLVPGRGLELGLDTADGEVIIWFGGWHGHITPDTVPASAEHLAAVIALLRDLIEERFLVWAVWQGEKATGMGGGYAIDNRETGEKWVPQVKDGYCVRFRSWRGTEDREVGPSV